MIADHLYVEFAVFTKDVWTMTSAVRNTDIGVLLVLPQLISSALVIPAESVHVLRL